MPCPAYKSPDWTHRRGVGEASPGPPYSQTCSPTHCTGGSITATQECFCLIVPQLCTAYSADSQEFNEKEREGQLDQSRAELSRLAVPPGPLSWSRSAPGRRTLLQMSSVCSCHCLQNSEAALELNFSCPLFLSLSLVFRAPACVCLSLSFCLILSNVLSVLHSLYPSRCYFVAAASDLNAPLLGSLGLSHTHSQ